MAGIDEALDQVHAGEELLHSEVAVGAGPHGIAVVVPGGHHNIAETGGFGRFEPLVGVVARRVEGLRELPVLRWRDGGGLPRIPGLFVDHPPRQVNAAVDAGDAPVDEEAEARFGEPLRIRVGGALEVGRSGLHPDGGMLVGGGVALTGAITSRHQHEERSAQAKQQRHWHRTRSLEVNLADLEPTGTRKIDH